MKRFALVTPLSNRTSVSEFSIKLAKAMGSSGCVMDLVGQDTHVPKRKIDAFNYQLADSTFARNSSSYSCSITSVGNNWEHHGAIYDLIKMQSHVAVLHDASLHHVLAYEIFEKQKKPYNYFYLMCGYYGMKGLETIKISGILTRTPSFGPWDSIVGSNFPFVGYYLRNASAIISHSKYASGVAAEARTPIIQLRLPGDEKEQLSHKQIESWKHRFAATETLELVTVGFINRAKNLEICVELLDQLVRLGTDARLTIAGGRGDEPYLLRVRTYIKRLGMDNRVAIRLDVSGAELASIKDNADVFLNFRFPNFEGCSAAAIECMMTQKPQCVYGTGFFSEIPSAAVLTLEELNSDAVAELAGKLHRLFNDDRKALLRMGALGHKFASGLKFEDYVRKLDAELTPELCRPKLAVSGPLGIEIDALFLGPRFAFMGKSPEETLQILAEEPVYGRFFGGTEFSKAAVRLMKKNPSLFWDFLGLVKSAFAGRFKSLNPRLNTWPKNHLVELGTLIALSDLPVDFFEIFLKALRINHDCRADVAGFKVSGKGRVAAFLRLIDAEYAAQLKTDPMLNKQTLELLE